MPKAKVTVRQLKNADSGIDVAITDCREQSSLLSVKLEYQILVVSNLSCFKTSEHKAEDVVQFVIRRRHDDFVELHRVLSIKYPSVILPGVSATGMAIFQDVNVKEQKDSLETFLRRVVTDKDLATSYLTLQFLGVNPIIAGNFQRNKHDVMDASVKKGIFEEDRDEEGLFAGDGETADEADLFTVPTAVGAGGDHQNTAVTTARLFDEQDLGGGGVTDVSGLLLPETSPTVSVKTIVSEHKEEEDLFNITDDLDDLLKQTKKKNSTKAPVGKPKLPPKPGENSKKPSLPPKPGLSKARSKDTNETDNLFGSSARDSDQNLEADDILKYIQDATSKQEEEVDLFS